MLEDSFVDRVLARKPVSRVINIVQEGRRTLQAYLAHGRAAYMTPDVITRELAHSVEQSLFSDVDTVNLEDPKRYLSFKTDTGEVSLGERFSIESFAAKFRPGAVVTVTPLGNVLNEVYLISAGDERLVAKKFTDWHSFKWFTLGLVSLGTRFFSVSGKARLENEYATNRLLSRRGVRVPEVLHISLPDRVLVERYIDGLSLAELAKKAAAAKSMSERDLGVASEAGKVMAKTHSAGVAMGDSKPENFQRAVDDSVYCLDLEQARKSGDKSWDIAEFLYYSGHYVFPRIPSGGFKEYVAAFIDGYKELGDKDTLKRAAGVKYGRVFSLWTPPLAIHEVVRALRNAS
jgi:tRNA A-37 threonylcarbamoyl transferase component Bud32